MMYTYLYDTDFLAKFDQTRIKEQFIRVILLDKNEMPIEAIEGEISNGGSVNINGKAALRRTANFTMIARKYAYQTSALKTQLAIGKKIKLEVGFTNTTQYYQEYPMLWFPQGVFVITNSSIAKSLSGINITLALKDKMCLLDGSCGGVFPTTVQLSKMDIEYADGTVGTEQPTIYRIIYELVTEFGKELPHKVIINDIDEQIKKVYKLNTAEPLYRTKVNSNDNSQLNYGYNISFDVPGEEVDYTIYNMGEDVGYILVPFTFPGELNGEAGGAITAALDKIKNVLGNYEYFYDIEGNFVFQQIKNYLNAEPPQVDSDASSATTTTGNYLINTSSDKSVYTFADATLISSYNNAPQYQSIKNDITIWGQRKTAEGATKPIRYHLALDNKPDIGNKYICYLYPIEGGKKAAKVVEPYNAGDTPLEGVVYNKDGQPQMYQKGEWESVTVTEITTADWRTELYMQGLKKQNSGKVVFDPYFTELSVEWPKIYDIQQGCFYVDDITTFDYYLDFIDISAADEFSVDTLGHQTKVINDDDINCLFARSVPNLVFITGDDDEKDAQQAYCESVGQPWVNIPDDFEDNFSSLGGTSNAAFDLMCSSLHEYTSYNENVTISAIPIYYLEPNTRITLEDDESDIHGDFMIQSITLPLDVNGAMSIQATRAVERY